MLWDASHQSARSEFVMCSHKRRLLLLCETYKQSSCHSTSSSSCQCERDISEVTNFCLTWIAHETCNNERIQTSRVVVIVWQWTSSNIESRRHCLLYFRFLNMLLLNHLMNQTREFAHYQYYCTHRRSRLMHSREHQEDHSKNCSLHFLCLQLHRWSRLKHNREQKRNHLERLISRCQKSIEFFTLLLIWSSFEHELLASRSLTWNSFEHELFASRSTWLQHFCLITSKWFDFCISAWSHRNDLKNHYSRDLRIWQIRIDRDVCRDRLTHLSLSDLLIKSSELVEISMILWSESLVNLFLYKDHLDEK